MAQAISNAAIDLFFKHGYEAATLRDVADKVGLKVASLYNYIDSKQTLLFNVMVGVMEDLLRDVEQAIAQEHDPLERLRAGVRSHVIFHASRTKEVFIGNSELRSLTPKNRTKVIRLRDAYEAVFRDIIQEGCDSGIFRIDDVRVATFALLAMCTGPSTWFTPRGRLTVAELTNLYIDLALRLLGVPPAETSANGKTAPARRRTRTS
jgi:TetR/AcrR family transcriptional regulator, cholesterol catabolism regulator